MGAFSVWDIETGPIKIFPVHPLSKINYSQRVRTVSDSVSLAAGLPSYGFSLSALSIHAYQKDESFLGTSGKWDRASLSSLSGMVLDGIMI